MTSATKPSPATANLVVKKRVFPHQGPANGLNHIERERIDPLASNAESTVERTADTTAPAKITYGTAGTCSSTSHGTICSPFSTLGSMIGPTNPRNTGISPTKR